ncbi:hypothetical protein [Neotamlana sedimentorum]|uniref:hypothetical protein n=1 Tax=Neotamlana sedimentorum TaxID=1435349 RepID=UPI00103D7817|nr:hypothetical protein [Tamlana sedimentorum]
MLIVSCHNDDCPIQPEPEIIQLKVIGKGTAVAQSKTFTHPITGEVLEADCYLMNLIDLDTKNTIGTLEDCVIEMQVPSDGTITSRVITLISIDGRGTIQAESSVFQEIQPPVQNLNFNTSYTPTENNVINTSFEFEGMEGTVSLVGEVSYKDFEEGILTFNNNFTIELKKIIE